MLSGRRTELLSAFEALAWLLGACSQIARSYDLIRDGECFTALKMKSVAPSTHSNRRRLRSSPHPSPNDGVHSAMSADGWFARNSCGGNLTTLAYDHGRPAGETKLELKPIVLEVFALENRKRSSTSQITAKSAGHIIDRAEPFYLAPGTGFELKHGLF